MRDRDFRPIALAMTAIATCVLFGCSSSRRGRILLADTATFANRRIADAERGITDNVPAHRPLR